MGYIFIKTFSFIYRWLVPKVCSTFVERLCTYEDNIEDIEIIEKYARKGTLNVLFFLMKDCMKTMNF